MNLKEFISESLTQLIDGVIDAQKRTRGLGAEIVPPVFNLPKSMERMEDVYHAGRRFLAHLVDFDVAVTVSETKEAGGTVGVVVAGIGLGGKGKSRANTDTTSRIRFKVPVMYPLGTNNVEEGAEHNDE